MPTLCTECRQDPQYSPTATHSRATIAVQLLRYFLARQSVTIPRRALGTPERTCARRVIYRNKTAGRSASSPHPPALSGFLFPNSLQDSAESESASGYERGIQRPYAASAADASGFLLVSLSKMPRLKRVRLRPSFMRRGISNNLRRHAQDHDWRNGPYLFSPACQFVRIVTAGLSDRAVSPATMARNLCPSAVG